MRGPRRGVRDSWVVLTAISWTLLGLAAVALKSGVATDPASRTWTGLTGLNAALQRMDAGIERLVRGSALVEEGPRQLLALLSRPGDGPVMAVVCGLASIVLWRIGERGWAWRVSVAAAVHGLLIRALKAWVDRPRPAHQDDGWVLVSGASFPSGHAAGGLFVYGLLALLCWTLRRGGTLTSTGARRWAGAASLSIGLWAGLTRPLLLVHHPSDLLGGWLLAAGMLALLWATRPGHREHLRHPSGG